MARYVRAPGVVAREVAGELVLVSTAPVSAGGRAGEFFVLNDTAEALWQALATAATADELTHRLVASYDIAPEQAASDVRGFLEAVCSFGVVQQLEE